MDLRRILLAMLGSALAVPLALASRAEAIPSSTPRLHVDVLPAYGGPSLTRIMPEVYADQSGHPVVAARLVRVDTGESLSTTIETVYDNDGRDPMASFFVHAAPLIRGELYEFVFSLRTVEHTHCDYGGVGPCGRMLAESDVFSWRFIASADSDSEVQGQPYYPRPVITSKTSKYGRHAWKVAGFVAIDAKASAGTLIYLQRRTHGKWRTVATTRTSSFGRYGFHYRAVVTAQPRPRYRVFVPERARTQKAASPSFFLRPRPR